MVVLTKNSHVDNLAVKNVLRGTFQNSWIGKRW